MCPIEQEQVNSSSDENINVQVIKHNTKCDFRGHHNSLPTTSDCHNVDFNIHTNIKIMSHKKLKLWLLINFMISIICIIVTIVTVFKLYSEVLEMQNKIAILSNRMQSMKTMYEAKIDELEQTKYEEEYVKTIVQPQQHTQILPDSSENRITDGALAAHFKGSLPEIHIKDQGLIGPWYPDNMVSRQYRFPKFHLTEGKYSIEVTEPALYFIYAQVYYISSNLVNSYVVYVRSEGSSENRVIAKCSTIGPNNSHVSEISCYTATVYSLNKNDRIFIQQTEKNRTIILRDGHSFFGLVRLNNIQQQRT